MGDWGMTPGDRAKKNAKNAERNLTKATPGQLQAEIEALAGGCSAM